MTAEVAVMNRQAIALAADSAITVSSIQGGRKAWPSASKIFGISSPHSVALMIYGSTSLHRLPWETIIKEFSTELPPKPYRRLEDYTTAFLRFVRSRRQYYPPAEQELFVFAKLVVEYLDLLIEIEGSISAALERSKTGAVTPAEQRKIISNVIDRWSANLKQAKRLPRLPKDYRQRFSKQYGRHIRRAKAEVFQALPLTQGQSRKLTTIGHLMFERIWLWESHSGLVVGGFGAQDLFPAHEHLTIEGFALDYLILNRRGTQRVERGMPASVQAFAQRDDVSAFMEGVLPAYQDQINRKFHELIVDRALEEFDRSSGKKGKSREKERRALSDAMHTRWSEELQDLYDFRRHRFIRPVLSVVAALPLEDLAVMAETLVNLTSFRQKVSMSVETVGGPVDVAVISKGDGFIWIKRKNYFRLDQNPRVLAKHFR